MGLDSSCEKRKDGVVNKVLKLPKFSMSVVLTRVCVKENMRSFVEQES